MFYSSFLFRRTVSALNHERTVSCGSVLQTVSVSKYHSVGRHRLMLTRNVRYVGQNSDHGSTHRFIRNFTIGISSLFAIVGVILGRKSYKDYKEYMAGIPEGCERYYDKDLGKTNKIVTYKGYYLPYFIENELKDIESFPVNETDVWIVTFPKSGTTWVQQIVYLIASNVDLERQEFSTIDMKIPYFEFISPGLKELQKLPSPRYFKSHLPYKLLPKDVHSKKCKIIYIARNPKDVTVSYYHFVRMITEIKYKGTFENFMTKFQKGAIPYGPWWDHVKEFWEHRNDENILFITYEDLHKDPRGQIVKIANFLGYKLDKTQIAKIRTHTRFEIMRDNPATNYRWWDTHGIRDLKEARFMRKGKIGDWINYYTRPMMEDFNALIEEKLKGTGLEFDDGLDAIREELHKRQDKHQ